MQSLLRRSLATSLLVFLLAALLLAAPAGAAKQPRGTETYAALLKQIDAGDVTSANINKKSHDVVATFKDGTKQTVIYPSHDSAALATRLRQHGASVTIRPKVKKVTKHHRLRYIVGGIVLVLLVGGLVVFAMRRRRPPEAAAASGGGVGAGAAPVEPPAPGGEPAPAPPAPGGEPPPG